jgi:hypothetical protein
MHPRQRARRATAPALAACLALCLGWSWLPSTTEATPVQDEVFRYTWSLGGIAGPVAGLFLPSKGQGRLSFTVRPNGHIHSELLITSEDSDKGEFWRYGSEIDPEDGSSLRAWSSYKFRGEKKSKEQDIEIEGIRDIVAGIHLLRTDPPTRDRAIEIWSDGKVYPVVIIPKGDDVVEVGKRKVPARRYLIKGRDVPGGRQWKGGMELWLSKDGAETPLEIRIERSLARVRLVLDPSA